MLDQEVVICPLLKARVEALVVSVTDFLHAKRIDWNPFHLPVTQLGSSCSLTCNVDGLRNSACLKANACIECMIHPEAPN